MTIQNVLKEVKEACVSTLLRSMFLVMFIGVVIAPLIMFAVGIRSFGTPGQPLLMWSFPGITLLLMTSISGGFLIFRYRSLVGKGLSISPKYR